MTKLALFAILSGLTFSAVSKADVSAISPGTREETVANVANQIFSVTDLKIGKWAYKIVAMDSELNGDLSSTTMVLVGEQGVGGLAGYDSAFQLSPLKDARNLKSVKIQNGALALTFFDENGKSTTKLYKYDSHSKTLREKISK